MRAVAFVQSFAVYQMWRGFKPVEANAVRRTLLSSFDGDGANGIVGFSEIRFTSAP